MRGFRHFLVGACVLFATANLSSNSAQALTVQLDGVRKFDQAQMDKLLLAKRVVEWVINSRGFRERVLTFEYKSNLEFVQNNGLTNQQIYDLLMSGAEKYPVVTEPDQAMNFDLELYKPAWYQSNNVLGYTSQDTKTIHINRNFYNRAEVYEIAMNLTHEWCHKVGFGHDSKNTARRPYSVPYGIGYIVRDLAQTFFN